MTQAMNSLSLRKKIGVREAWKECHMHSPHHRFTWSILRVSAALEKLPGPS